MTIEEKAVEKWGVVGPRGFPGIGFVLRLFSNFAGVFFTRRFAAIDFPSCA